METLTLATPAKINLYLRTLGRRPDSYHEIETLFYPLPGIADTVTVTFTDAEEIVVHCSAEGVPEDSSNLCWKAACLYRETAGIRCGMEITLIKRIPVAAGMGGGSSDAAAVLRILQKKYGALDSRTLSGIAARIGADVPFFLNPATAVGRGVGDELEVLSGIPEKLPVLIAAPGFPVSAAWSYRHLDHVRTDADERRLEPLLDALRSSDFRQTAEFLRNDLEHAVMEKFPLNVLLKQHLEGDALRVMVSGSGPTLFAFYESFEAREKAFPRAEQIARKYAVALLKP